LINDKPLDEPYAKGAMPGDVAAQAEEAPTRLDHDEYYVMGDNRSVSVYGEVLRKQILGEIVSF
jgi:hypothetical protein